MNRATVLIATATALAGAGLGYSLHPLSTSEPPSRNLPVDELSPVALLELAASAESNDPDRADLLVQAAVERLKHDPAALPSFWSDFEQYRASRPALTSEELLARLLIIEDATEAAIQACRSKSQLETTLRVHEKIEQTILDARNAVVDKVIAEVEQFGKDHDKQSSRWLEQFALKRPGWERRLSAAVGIPPTASQKFALEKLASMAPLLQEEVDAQARQFEAALERSRTAIATNENQPDKSGSHGTLQNHLDELERFSQAVELGDLEGWQQFLSDARGTRQPRRGLRTEVLTDRCTHGYSGLTGTVD